MTTTITVPAYITSLGFDDWWLPCGCSPEDAVAAYRAKGAGSYEASKVNLANPGTYNLTEGVAPIWNATDGWIMDGTKYLLTTESITYNQNFTMIARYSNCLGGLYTTYTLGGFENSGYTSSFLMVLADGEGWVSMAFIDGSASVAEGPNEGILCVSIPSFYINKVPSNVPAPTAFSKAHKLLIGTSCSSDGTINTSTLLFIGNIQAYALYNKQFTPTQVSDLTDSMNDL